MARLWEFSCIAGNKSMTQPVISLKKQPGFVEGDFLCSTIHDLGMIKKDPGALQQIQVQENSGILWKESPALRKSHLDQCFGQAEGPLLEKRSKFPIKVV